MVAFGEVVGRIVPAGKDEFFYHGEGIFCVDFCVQVDTICYTGTGGGVFEGEKVREIGNAVEEEGAVEVEGGFGRTDEDGEESIFGVEGSSEVGGKVSCRCGRGGIGGAGGCKFEGHDGGRGEGREEEYDAGGKSKFIF